MRCVEKIQVFNGFVIVDAIESNEFCAIIHSLINTHEHIF